MQGLGAKTALLAFLKELADTDGVETSARGSAGKTVGIMLELKLGAGSHTGASVVMYGGPRRGQASVDPATPERGAAAGGPGGARQVLPEGTPAREAPHNQRKK